MWKLIPFGAELAPYSNGLILAGALALGLVTGRVPGRTFLDSGGAWALVAGQVLLLLLGKAIYVWYPLLASVCLFVAVMSSDRAGWRQLAWPVVTTLAITLLQGGSWTGSRLDPEVLARSAVWTALMVGLFAWSVRRLRRAFRLVEPAR